jgi:hypothetical protein
MMVAGVHRDGRVGLNVDRLEPWIPAVGAVVLFSMLSLGPSEPPSLLARLGYSLLVAGVLFLKYNNLGGDD